MQKNRPVGVTILAIWAFAGSGIMFAFAASTLGPFPAEFHDFLAFARFVVVPLGAPLVTLAGFNYIDFANVGFGVLYAVIGFFTLKGSRLAWFSNVGLSLAISTHFIYFLGGFYGSITMYLDPASMFYDPELGVLTLSTNLTYIATIGIRLYYLFRPNVRDFFGTKTLFVQKRTA